MPGFLPTPLAVKPGKEGREEGRANVFLSAYCAPGTALPQAGVTRAPLLAQSGPGILGIVTQGWASASGHLPFPLGPGPSDSVFLITRWLAVCHEECDPRRSYVLTRACVQSRAQAQTGVHAALRTHVSTLAYAPLTSVSSCFFS